jgi:hypothetical protein
MRQIQLLRQAFNSGFKEGAEGVMHMPEEDAEVFDNFVNWLYRDKPCHNELANPVMDHIQDIHLKDRSVFAAPMLREFYSKARENSKIRQYGTSSNLWDTRAATKVQGDVPEVKK